MGAPIGGGIGVVGGVVGGVVVGESIKDNVNNSIDKVNGENAEILNKENINIASKKPNIRQK